MDAQQFLYAFRHIVNAPGGLIQLRQMIYQLAVTGALISRDDRRNDAATLLADVQAKRTQLIKEKKYKRMPALEGEPLRLPGEVDLPPWWRWTRLLDIGEINPRNDAKDDELAAFLPMSGVPQRHGQGLVVQTKRWVEIKKGYTHFAVGDVVLAKITPCFENGKAASITNLPNAVTIGAGTTELHVFRPIHPGILPEYIHIYLRSPLFVVEGKRKMTGTAGQKRLPTDYFATCPVPLPPTEQQSRIVAKVDELMVLCDQLENQQQARAVLQDDLRQHALQAVIDANSASQLKTAWARLDDNFTELLRTPENVKELRNLILQLAVRGLFVDQMESSSVRVEELVSAVEAKRSRLIADGVVRRAPPAAPIEIGEEPFTLPKGWKFVRLGQISICRDAQRVPLSKAERDLRRGPFPYYGASGVIDSVDDFIFDGPLLLVGEDGANLINRSTPIAFIAKGRYWVNNHAHVLDTASEITLKYLELFINAIDLRPYVTGSAQPKMNQEKMNLIVIAVPPPKEQAQIVERVSELLQYCDVIEAQLHEANKYAGELATAVISDVIGIAIAQAEDQPVKPPETELIAPIRLSRPPDAEADAPLAILLARHNGTLLARDLWQRFGGEIDAFYAQLKNEVAQGWVAEPEVAEVREKPSESAVG